MEFIFTHRPYTIRDTLQSIQFQLVLRKYQDIPENAREKLLWQI